MTSKKLIITGIITVGVLAGIATCITMTDKEENVETVAEVQTAEEPKTEVEQEEDGVLMGKGDGTMVEVAETDTDTEKSAEETLTDLYAGAIVETETAEEEEFMRSTAGDEEIVNDEVTDMDATMYATQNVNLRQGTAVTTESLRLVGFAEEVKVTGITVNKQWYRVEDASKGVGFIASSYLSDTKPEQNTSSQQASSGSSESTQSSGGGSTDTQSGGGSSSVPGISQSDMDAVMKAVAGQTAYTGPTGQNAGYLSNAGGRSLNQ